jgi:hypothetical protein
VKPVVGVEAPLGGAEKRSRLGGPGMMRSRVRVGARVHRTVVVAHVRGARAGVPSLLTGDQ